MMQNKKYNFVMKNRNCQNLMNYLGLYKLLYNLMFSDIAEWYGSVSAYKDTNKFAKLCHL